MQAAGARAGAGTGGSREAGAGARLNKAELLKSVYFNKICTFLHVLNMQIHYINSPITYPTLYCFNSSTILPYCVTVTYMLLA